MMSFKERFKNFFSIEDEYEYIEEVEADEKSTLPHEKDKSNKNVVNLSAIQQPNTKVILCEPTTFNEVQNIAEHIINRRSVVINLQRVDHTQAKRIIDFLSGTVYALKGNIQKLGSETFLCAPDNVDVSGTISELTTVNGDEFERGW